MTNSSRLQKRKAEALLDLFGKKAFLANGKCYPKTKSSSPGYNVYSLKLPEALSPEAMQKVEDNIRRTLDVTNNARRQSSSYIGLYSLSKSVRQWYVYIETWVIPEVSGSYKTGFYVTVEGPKYFDPAVYDCRFFEEQDAISTVCFVKGQITDVLKKLETNLIDYTDIDAFVKREYPSTPIEDLPVFTFGMHTGNFASLPD